MEEGFRIREFVQARVIRPLRNDGDRTLGLTLIKAGQIFGHVRVVTGQLLHVLNSGDDKDGQPIAVAHRRVGHTTDLADGLVEPFEPGREVC